MKLHHFSTSAFLLAGLCLSACRNLDADPSRTKSLNGPEARRSLSDKNPPDASIEGIEAAKNWTAARLPAAEADFAATGLKRYESPTFWGKEIVYSIQVDRFNNGDLNNDAASLPETDLSQMPGSRHGGDLRGILDRLDYLSDLGITTLWLTPVFKHTGAYHGYCATDPTQVDPGFGTKEELRSLVTEAHKRNIKVVLDIVVNHLCDLNSSYSTQPQHNRCANDLNLTNWNGGDASSSAQGMLKMSDTFFPLFRRQEFFNRCGTNSGGDTSGEGPETMFGDFANGMYDYNTKNRDFQALFTDLHKWWIAYADVDGFRLDAAKHVTEDYLAYFSTHVRDYAQKIGKKNFYIVGEVAASPDWSARRIGNMMSDIRNPNTHGNIPASLTYEINDLKPVYTANTTAAFPGMNAVYDFIYSGDSRGYLLGQTNGGAVEWDLTSPNHSVMAAQSDPRLNWIVLEIHDWPRFTREVPTDRWKSKLGLSYLATAQGIPVIYYGMEQGFTGLCEASSFKAGKANSSIQNLCRGSDDAMKRQDMFINGPWRLGSTVPSIQQLASIGPSSAVLSPDWKQDPLLARDHDVYKTSRRFNHLRTSCAPLYQGQTLFRWHANTNLGLLIYSRIDDGKELVVVVNNTSAPLPLPDVIISDASTQTYRNAVNEVQTAKASGSSLKLNGLTIEGNTVGVFAPESMLGAWDDDLGARLCKKTLKHRDEFSGDI
ncbi:MAG: hypothetical protein H7249_08345 [Chitinophagaceae bacterium]|nr:hypothetical protein [Oligoflexus sp.]